ncbi:4Fe-4S binding protein [Lacrimispora sp.]|uniref:4Fe-4S binding protein n=1 Tax=Lacrimispora sp. TaxID=2719234 RepID=UPI002ED12087
MASVSQECVACGCCMKVCPLKAISIPTGIRAQVDISKCIGCGKCAAKCPAFAFGFYSVMLTSTVLGLITMLLFKPRSWCVYCPMGTMTQGICMIKHKKGEYR